jgi:hypothetical protein
MKAAVLKYAETNARVRVFSKYALLGADVLY